MRRYMVYNMRMRLLITSTTKYVLLAIVSVSFFIVWNPNYYSTINWSSPVVQLPTFPIWPSEISPNAFTHSSTPSIWNSLVLDFKLDHQVHSLQVKKEIRKLLKDPDELYKMLQAARPYIYFIYKQIKVRGLPAELALIPLIESEFNPNDKSSRAGARGLWQLMRGTAKGLGVEIKNDYDGRKNVAASTNAALTYFRDLNVYFKGDWYLTLAAYNSGEGRVKAAMRRSGSEDFWKLHLPRETKIYVPKLLAVAAIIKNHESYGVKLPSIADKPFFEAVKVSKPVNLHHMAKTLKVDIKKLHALNPDLVKSKTIPKKMNNTILVPIKTEKIV